MKAGVLLTLLCVVLSVASLVTIRLYAITQEQQRKIDYYELSLSEIGNDMAINYKLHKNALHALRSCR